MLMLFFYLVLAYPLGLFLLLSLSAVFHVELLHNLCCPNAIAG